MALRLRKDVAKSSYYVWFLGAEEARGLRGPRVLLPVIPYLIERSREIEPIKVTLQLSSKGMKIIQGSSKHFITHSAITCSVQTDDIVACVLLLYNPVTKCPLHVHAYRCDSKITAQALNDQMQTLINRPENQVRFEDLEARLGLMSCSSPPRNIPPPKAIQSQNKRTEPMASKHFDSSLGSDTGTSTRESECSEEQITVGPVSPTPNKSTLFDSLAAELRAKLNGNGPPLLLPPRDYDTVHRSKGNLAATELRRCRNSLIVGAGDSANDFRCNTIPSLVLHQKCGPLGTGPKQGVSSRGSSGIGSDLAPSPERREGHSSSDEDWFNKRVDTIEKQLQSSSSRRHVPKPYAVTDIKPTAQLDKKQPPSYLYPSEKPSFIASKNPVNTQRDRPISNDIEKAFIPKREEEIRPKLVRPRNLEAQFKQILEDKRYGISSHANGQDDRDYNSDPKFSSRADWKNEKNRHSGANDGKGLARTKSNPNKSTENMVDDRHDKHHLASGKSNGEYNKYLSDEEECLRFRENLTDKQKYRESLLEKLRKSDRNGRDRHLDDNNGHHRSGSHSRDVPLEPVVSSSQTRNMSKYDGGHYKEHNSIDRKAYRPKNVPPPNYNDIEFERNPYKEPESLPYHESIERMIKSPAMRYKSVEGNNSKHDGRITPEPRDRDYPHRGEMRSHHHHERREYSHSPIYDTDEAPSRHRYRQPPQRSLSRSPDVHRSPNNHRYDRNEKDKFRSIERDLAYSMEKVNHSRRIDPEKMIRNSGRQLPSHHDPALEWSSEDDQYNNCRGPSQSTGAGRSNEHFEKKPNVRLTPSKSLGNLVKGYRHSYAEPRAPMPRNSGRVGLAAVNPF